MKKKILWAGLFLCIMGMSLPSCSDEDTPTIPGSDSEGEETQALVGEKFYIGDNRYGVQIVSMLDQGEDVKYTFELIRAGKHINPEETVTLNVMTPEELEAYNSENMTDYAILPEGTYAFTAEYKGFSVEAPKQTAEITLKASIADLDLDATDYVLPLRLSASAAEVDEERGELILRPVVTRPTVYFMGDLNTEVNVYKEDVSNTVPSSEFSMILDRDNQGWNFGVEFESDETALQALVSEYNTQNSASYTLLPSENYTLSEANFTAENPTPTLSVSYNELGKLTVDQEYLLPIKMKECTGMSFGVDDRIIYIPVKVFDLLKINLTADDLWVITEAGDRDATTGNLPEKKWLVDGDAATTFWQSMWYKDYGTYYRDDKAPNDETYGVYMDITLKEELTRSVRFKLSIHNSQNNYPKKTSFYGSSDGGNTWTKLKTVNELFSNISEETTFPYSVTTEDYELNSSISKLRIAFESNGSGATLTQDMTGSYYSNIKFSELELWGY